MSRKLQQFFIRKLNSSRLKNSDYKIQLTLNEARKNNEIVSVGDNEVFRTIRRITNNYFDQQKLSDLQKEKRKIKKLPRSKENMKELLKTEKEIDDILFCEDVVSVLINDTRHYRTIIKKGLFINGKKFVRLLAGAGNIRRNTVIFINEEIYNQVDTILNNGRNKDIPLVPAKFSAYYALAFSSGYSVSTPSKILVVNDCEIEREFLVDWVGESNDEEVVEKKEKILMNLFDGQGLISPRLAFKWQEELGLDYTPSSFIIRAPFLKGMVATFSYERFAEEIANEYFVSDVWGNKVDIREVDIIISASQFKLYKAYDSVNDYMQKCKENGLGWSISRYGPKVDKTHMTLNYQFIQVLELNDEQIKKLCKKTIDFFRYSILEKPEYALLYLLGSYIDKYGDENWFENIQDVVTKSLIINPELLHDPYIQQCLIKSLNKQIKQSYLGKLIQTGNYQMMVSDPFGQCQHIWGLPVTGILKESEYYSWFWNDRKVSRVAACRAPLTVGSEVNILDFQNNKELSSWYFFIRSGIVYNVHGNDMLIHGGSDLDGDIIATIDSKEMIDGATGGNPVAYAKKEAVKTIIDESELWKTDILGMNSKVGFLTNLSTSIFSMLPLFEKNSLEYEELVRRLRIFRALQGSEIDSGKGIVKRPVPSSWSKWQKKKPEMSDDKKKQIDFENGLIADRRPLFFKHLYYGYNKKYKKFLQIFESISQCRLGVGIQEILSKSREELNEEEINILDGYNKFNPLINTDSIMNKISRYLEKEIIELKLCIKNVYYDSSVLINKSISIDKNKLISMKKLYGEYKTIKRNHNREEIGDDNDGFQNISQEFRLKMEKISSNESELVNLLVQILYVENPKSSSKDMLWSILSDGILENIKQNSKQPYLVPIQSEYESISFMGKTYEMVEIQ